jgi:8-oxo-dGTP diphosphatase
MVVRAVLGAVCIIRTEESVLLLYRNHEPFKGKWDALTGLVEFGETPAEAARREALEEAGLEIWNCDHRGHLLLYNVDNCTAIAADLFVTSDFRGELRGSEEGMPVWVPISTIHEVDLVDFIHLTLPRILTPGTFLRGTISHHRSGEPVQYLLEHHGVDPIETLSRGLAAV